MVNKCKTFDVVLVNFGTVEFAGEQSGTRPAVVIQNALGNIHSDTTIVLPFSTKLKNLNQSTHSFFVKNEEYGLREDSVLLGECVRQVSKERIIKKLGSFDKKEDRMEIKRAYDANFGEI